MDSLSVCGIDFSRLKGFEPSPDEKSVAKGVLERYEHYMEKGNTLTITFSLATTEGDLVFQDGECKVVLPNKEILGREYNPYARASRLNQSYVVKVISG